MRIACLAWGSLVWEPGAMVFTTAWRQDGPALPIEFARVGEKGELATVIEPGAPRQPTRWAIVDASDLEAARDALRRREGIDLARAHWIGAVSTPASGPRTTPHADEIAGWAGRRGVDAVVWTASPPCFAGEDGRTPTLDEAIAYLDGLRGGRRDHARHYVRHVPTEIRTPYRGAIEARLGWTAAG